MLDKIKEWTNSVIDSMKEQVWFQELKAKWEELDPQSKTYLKRGLFAAGLLSVFLLILSSIWSVHALKQDLSEKRRLLAMLQSANDEIRSLKAQVPNLENAVTNNSSLAGGNSPTWTTYFETLAVAAGMDKSAVSCSNERPGITTAQTKEVLYDVNLKHVNIKQVVRYAVSLENGQRPLKLRNLLIDTKGDPSGYLDATLAVSGFSLVKNDSN